MQINPNTPLSIINLIPHKKQYHYRSRQIRFKKRFHFWASPNWEKSNVKLSDETENVKSKTDPGSNDSEHRGEGEVVFRAPVLIPGFAEAYVGEANRTPSKEVGKAGEGEEPGEDGISLGCFVNVCQKPESEGDDENDVGTPALVHLCAPAWAHALCAQSLHGASRGEGAGISDGDDGDGDNGVEYGWEGFDMCEAEGEDEGRVLGLSAGSLGELVIVGGNDETKERERDDVEEADTPENLLGRFGDRLSRIFCFCCCETDEFGASEGEGGGHEDGTEAFETIAEGAWVLPVCATDVAAGVGRDSAAVDDDSENDETDDCGDFDDTEYEFDFTVASDTTDIDDSYEDEEDGDPDTHVDGIFHFVRPE